ncbi:MarR family transcriptional regulator [Streptomyces lunaelactis]|uniref:MarR family winged helix-turn-helix transcriptional regulator n=1 Tax=Streptomyces lunaelactis TaxID=1535768 RepID=UPI0015844AA1|nr:MarR family transcriptional regulator [Streptomyces lunaelactis]NUK25608.1 MarR family transcriptional regulator [Streptomyces lunaelactis]NUK53247.1 MarR family transcriptional regulator [Streptomyces lunaelactis]NUK64904.1 MarR family transcriptional regulator [Streptomyces lunaelactis]
MDATEPQWLDEGETHTWLSLVALATRLPAALDAQLQRHGGMTHFEYHVMATLGMAPEGAMRPSDLATAVGGSLSRLSHLLRRLEDKGWIERTPDPSDTRYSYASLTPAGQEKMARTAPGHVATARRLVFDALTPAQQRQLTVIGERVCSAIDQNDARNR